MVGFEAISYHNGWAMSLVGITIVLSCLVFLSVVISQLHKLLELMETRKKTVSDVPNDLIQPASQTSREIIIPNRFPDEIGEAAKLYLPLIEKIGISFPLVDLYKAARDHEYPHPHLTISAFRQAGILSVVNDGVFNWTYSD